MHFSEWSVLCSGETSAEGVSAYMLRARSWRVKVSAAFDLGGRGFRNDTVEIFVSEEASLVGELLEAVELEHESLVKRGVSRLVGIPEAFPLGVKLNLVAALGWQCPEKTVGVEVVVPILYVVGGIGWRERSVMSSCFFWEVHFSW